MWVSPVTAKGPRMRSSSTCAMDSFYRHLAVPDTLTWDSDRAASFRRTSDLGWPPADHPERIVTRNYGSRVVVCTTTLDLPHVERSSPVFTDLNASDWDADTDRIAAVIDAATAHLDPDGPPHFRYGVKFHGFQTLSNTPDRFIEDLQTIHLYVDGESDVGEPTDPAKAIERRSGLTAAALWPVRDGWFYLEGVRVTDSDRSRWQYGVLLPDPLVDVDDVRSFFDAFTDEPPRYLRQWPRRTLQADGSRNRPPLTHTVEVTDELAVEDLRGRSALPIHASNPFYGTDIESLVAELDSIPSALYDPLQSTSSFLFELQGTFLPEAEYKLDHVVAVEPPARHSLFVAAQASFHGDREY